MTKRNYVRDTILVGLAKTQIFGKVEFEISRKVDEEGKSMLGVDTGFLSFGKTKGDVINNNCRRAENLTDLIYNHIMPNLIHNDGIVKLHVIGNRKMVQLNAVKEDDSHASVVLRLQAQDTRLWASHAGAPGNLVKLQEFVEGLQALADGV